MVSQQVMQQIQSHIHKHVHHGLAEAMSNAHPDDKFTHTPGGGIEHRGDAPDTKAMLKYYKNKALGKNATKATAASQQALLTAHEESVANGTVGHKYLNHPQVRKSLPEYLAKNFKNTPQINIK